MKITKLSVLLIILIIISVHFSADAQTVDPETLIDHDIIPPSPDAASLGKYGEYPVNEYCGKADVSIPLYTAKSRDLSINISLNYDASGIKVEDIASWVGQGWTLNAGGVITRAVNGNPDDLTGNNNTAYYYSNNNTDQYIYDLFNRVNDGQPDIFYFNFGSYSGKFIIKDNQFYCIPYQQLKIECLSNNADVKYFVITTPDGIKYTFGKSENTNNKTYEITTITTSTPNGANNENIYISAWYLEKIESLTHDFVDFKYDIVEEDGINYGLNLSESKKFYLGYNPNSSIYGTNQCNATVGSSKATVKNYSSMTVDEIKLTEINTQNGKIKFISYNDRLDSDSKRLDKIEIYNKVNNQYIFDKRFLFDYFYSNSQYKVESFSPDIYKYRLFLQKITESSSLINGEGELNPYNFSYNFSINVNPFFPPRDSKCQDFWGYNNGSDNDNFSSPTLIPQFDFYENGANRMPDENSMLKGMLTKITYPTKGYTFFTYEAHRAMLYPSFFYFNNDYTIPNNGTQISQTISASPPYNTYASYTLDWDSNTCSNPNVTYELESCDNYEKGGIVNTGYIKITDITSTQQIKYQEVPIDGILNGTYNFNDLGFINGHEYKFESEVENANLAEMILTYNYSGNGSGNGGSSTTKEQEVKEEYLIGGARIKSIINHYGNENPDTKIVYDYNEDNHSSGKLFTRPIFNYISLEGVCELINNNYRWTGDCVWQTLQSISQTSLSSPEGNYIGYSKITKTYFADNKTNGKEVYIFNNPDKNFNTDFPFASQDISSSLRGKLIEHYIFDNLGNIKKKTTNQFVFDSFNPITANSFYGCKVGQYRTFSGSHEQIDKDDFLTLSTYNLYSGWDYLQKSTEEKYTENGVLTTESNYFYENPEHTFLTKEVKKIINSDTNYVLTKKYKYPQDITDGSVPSQMISKFILQNVIDYEEFNKNNKQIAGSKANYIFNSSDDLVLLNKIKTYNTVSENYENKVNFLYNTYGQIKQKTKENDIPTAVIWGYNHTFPVAIIENAEYDSFIGMTENNIENIYDENDLIGHLIFLYPHYPDSNITLFAYNQQGNISISIDKNKRKTSYFYDDFGRLKLIKDQDGNIIKTFDYHYKQD